MLDNVELLAVIFYLAGGLIRGLTRLHKVVFLVEHEVGLGDFAFRPSKYGPWSPDLDSLVRGLIRGGSITVKEEVLRLPFPRERPIKVLTASNGFLKEGKMAFEMLKGEDFSKAWLLRLKVASYLHMPITYLLAYVYIKYPEFVKASVIGEKVKEWQRFYGLTGDEGCHHP